MARFYGLGVKRKKAVNIRLTEQEFFALKDMARAEEISVMSYIRRKIFGREVPKADSLSTAPVATLPRLDIKIDQDVPRETINTQIPQEEVAGIPAPRRML